MGRWLKTGTGFFSDASGDRYKRSSRQVTQISQSSQGGDIKFRSQTSGSAGAVISWHEMAKFGRSEVVFNDGGLDQNFRVKSDNNSNMLVVDGGDDTVSIGSSGYTTTTDLNLLGDGLSIKNDKSGNSNNWSLIQNTAVSSQSNLEFRTGLGIALTLNHDKSATFGSDVLPYDNGASDLGSPSKRWANVYTGDLHLSNEDKGANEMDGTTGNWTIQEGAENLYIKNNKTGKKYKFALEEIE